MQTNEPPAGDAYTGIFLYNEAEEPLPINQALCKEIVKQVQKGEKCAFLLVEIVFVDEQGITALNKEHLDRTYVTDIITFRYDQDDSNQAVEGTLYCCAPRISQQAGEYGELPENEFCRIVIHGLLHLVGYEDKSKSDRQAMRSRENFYLEQL